MRAWLPQSGVVKSMTHSAALGRAGDLPIRSARGETLVQPPNRAGAIEAVCKELDEAEQQGGSRRLSRKRSVNHADGMFGPLPLEAAPLCGEVAAAAGVRDPRWWTAAQLPDPGHVRNANPRGSSITRPA